MREVIARMVETGDALIEVSRVLTVEGAVSQDGFTIAAASTARAKLEAAIAEARALLATAVREPVVVETLGEDGLMVSRVER
jgi:hypothetical protein